MQLTTARYSQPRQRPSSCRMRLQRLAHGYTLLSHHRITQRYHTDSVYLHSRSTARVLLMRCRYARHHSSETVVDEASECHWSTEDKRVHCHFLNSRIRTSALCFMRSRSGDHRRFSPHLSPVCSTTTDNQSINQSIKVTKVTNVTAIPLIQC